MGNKSNSPVPPAVGSHYYKALSGAESAYSDHAKSSTSSATGRFQFTNETWLDNVKAYGKASGYPKLMWAADHLGDRSPVARERILALRSDPLASFAMARVFTQGNLEVFMQTFGEKPTPTQLQVMHWRGRAGGLELERVRRTAPDTVAADILPRDVILSNANIFYRKSDGYAFTVQEIFNNFEKKLLDASQRPTSPIVQASGAQPRRRDGLSGRMEVRVTRAETARPRAKPAAAPKTTIHPIG